MQVYLPLVVTAPTCAENYVAHISGHHWIVDRLTRDRCLTPLKKLVDLVDFVTAFERTPLELVASTHRLTPPLPRAGRTRHLSLAHEYREL
jgi:hypothetical protein